MHAGRRDNGAEIGKQPRQAAPIANAPLAERGRDRRACLKPGVRCSGVMNGGHAGV